MKNCFGKRLPRSLVGFLSASVVTALCATAGTAQESSEGAFVDGEFVEGYAYLPEFMSPGELKKHMDEGSDEVVIVDTAATLIFEEEHIPGAINFPWVHEISLPVGLPRDKTIVLYCACQNHEDSADMAEKLSHAGYYNVEVLEGGWFEWLDLGYAIAGLASEAPQ